MTVRVIYDGATFSIVKCQNCGVLLEYTRADEKETSRSDYLGDVSYYFKIECPKCKGQTTTKVR